MTDRDRILQKTNGGLDVFTHYMGEACKKKVFRNPFRTDSNPSCHLYYNEDKMGGEGRFILKDFGDSDWHGDCFWLVGRLTGLNVKTDFLEILHTIDRECELFILDDAPVGYHPVMKKVTPVSKTDNRPVKFTPKYRNFNKHELAYWQSYGISLDILSRFHVRCLSSCYFERADGTYYNIYGTMDVPMFGYTFNDGTGIKVYRPNAEIGRFMYAGNLPKPYIFGMEQLPLSESFVPRDIPVHSEYLFITGGEKDVMSLAARGFRAISLNSETAKLPYAVLDVLLWHFSFIIFLYDCDETGIRESGLRVKECCEYRDEMVRQMVECGGTRCDHTAATILNLSLPLEGSKKEKDISDFFRSGHTAQELKMLVSVAINNESSKE